MMSSFMNVESPPCIFNGHVPSLLQPTRAMERDAARFEALYAEYRKAPEVTRTRLYLETMEVVLPDVDKVIIEPGTTQVLPYLPLRSADPGVTK